MALKPTLLAWLAGHDTGMSSRALLAWMERDLTVAAMDHNRMEYPHDPADLGRCIRLMDVEPSYRARIGEMASVGPEWARLVSRWADLEALYHEEYPTGYAPKCYALMQQLLYGKESA